MPVIALILKLMMLEDVIISYTNKTFINDNLNTEKKSFIINVSADFHLRIPMEKVKKRVTDV